MFDHQVVYPHVLTLNDEFQTNESTPAIHAQLEECSIWGPTCDSIDCVQPKAVLPTNLVQVGDWLRWDNMGAYTICAASQVRSPFACCFFSCRIKAHRFCSTLF
jgi:ornithine decarboxylase